MAAPNAFLLGRRIDELFAGHWALITDPGDVLAARLNSLPKYVVSKTLSRTGWNNSTLLQGDLFEEVAELRRRTGNEVQVQRQAHQDADGPRPHRRVPAAHPPRPTRQRQRLFGEGTTPTALELVDTKTTSRGVAIHVYRPAGMPHYGSVLLKEEGDIVRSDTA